VGEWGRGKRAPRVQNLDIHRPHRYIRRLTDEYTAMYIRRWVVCSLVSDTFFSFNIEEYKIIKECTIFSIVKENK
jgi:hypothetical protein